MSEEAWVLLISLVINIPLYIIFGNTWFIICLAYGIALMAYLPKTMKKHKLKAIAPVIFAALINTPLLIIAQFVFDKDEYDEMVMEKLDD